MAWGQEICSSKSQFARKSWELGWRAKYYTVFESFCKTIAYNHIWNFLNEFYSLKCIEFYGIIIEFLWTFKRILGQILPFLLGCMRFGRILLRVSTYIHMHCLSVGWRQNWNLLFLRLFESHSCHRLLQRRCVLELKRTKQQQMQISLKQL